MHNYHETYNRFPLPGLVTIGTGVGVGGLVSTSNWTVAILPYIDQANVYNLYNSNLSAYDPANVNAVSAIIPGMICPSTPRASNSVSVTVPAPMAAAIGVASVLTLTNAGANDYTPTTAVDGNYLNIANNTSGSVDTPGWATGAIIYLNAMATPTIPDGGRLADITDGTSNTMMIGELAGRNQLYRRGKPVASATAVGAMPSEEAGWQLAIGGGAWADPFNGVMELAGRAVDGTGNNGPCAINCSNSRARFGRLQEGAGLYSWHTGGAHGLLGDGSVRFLSENISAKTLSSLITRSGGEIVGEF